MGFPKFDFLSLGFEIRYLCHHSILSIQPTLIARHVPGTGEYAGERLMVALLHGTGSYPPGLRGWQRLRRLMAIQPPLRSPYFSMAS